MNDNETERRLRDFGSQPLDPQTRRAHLARIEAAGPALNPRGRRRFGIVAVGAAGVLGFLAGSTGLAMAGALPDPAQDVAHDVFGFVQVEVPEGTRGSCISQAAKIKDKADKQDAKDACPKPSPDDGDNSDDDSDDDSDGQGPADEGGNGSTDAPGGSEDAPRSNGNGKAKHDGDPCRGRPAWAGQMTPEQKAELKAANSREGCGGEEAPDDVVSGG